MTPLDPRRAWTQPPGRRSLAPDALVLRGSQAGLGRRLWVSGLAMQKKGVPGAAMRREARGAEVWIGRHARR